MSPSVCLQKLGLKTNLAVISLVELESLSRAMVSLFGL